MSSKFIDKVAAAFQDELLRIKEKQAMSVGTAVPLMAGGALTWEFLRRANQDRQLGKQMRMQSSNQVF